MRALPTLRPMRHITGPNGLTRLLYTPTDAAELLGFSRSRLYRLLASGELECVHVGGVRRVPTDALTSYVQALRAQPPGPPSAA